MAIVVPAYASIPDSLRVGWETVVDLWDVIFDSEKRAAAWQSVVPALAFTSLVIAFLVFDHFSPWRERIRAQFSTVDQLRQRHEERAEAGQEDETAEGEPVQRLPSKLNILIDQLITLSFTAIFTTFPSVFAFASITHIYHVPYSHSAIKETVRRPWLPLEVIQTKTFTYVGYSVSVKDGWHAILTEDERAIQYVPVTDIVARQVCRKASESLSQPAPLIDFSEKKTSVWRLCPVVPGRDRTRF
ncbi:hypothetical protein [Nonomuraea sp. NPDC003754]